MAVWLEGGKQAEGTMASEREGQAQDLKVMVVDDDVVFLRYLDAQLKMIGYQVVTVESGVAAWILIQAEPPDLVLLDIFMPGMGGLELCRKIKDTPGLQDIPVVLLTMMGPKAKDGGYQAGADDFLNKPPHLLELKTRIRNLLLLRQLRAAQPRDPEALQAEALTGATPRILILDGMGLPRASWPTSWPRRAGVCRSWGARSSYWPASGLGCPTC